jgi:glycosyltransferase involved in cell wall biosynthesis
VTRRPRVVYWNNMPSPYVVGRLNSVVERGSLDISAWFSTRREADRSWAVDETSFRFPYTYLPTISGRRLGLDAGELAVPQPLLQGSPPDLLVSLYAGPAYIAGWSLAKARGVRTAFRYLPTSDNWVRRTRFKEGLKRRLFQSVDGFKTSGPDGHARLVGYGVDPQRIHVVTQSIDFGRFQVESDKWQTRRAQVRAELGLEGVVFLYVGRLWRGKGLDLLIDAYQRHAALGNGASTLMLVGDGRDEARYRAQAAAAPGARIVFAGFIQSIDLPRYYAAADVFVFPTLGDPNGLVVEEAMSCALPVVAFDAAGDVSLRVPDGVAGYVVPTADGHALQRRMGELSADAELRRRMGAAGRQIASAKTHGQYAEDFERFVEQVLRSRRAGLQVLSAR